MKFVITLILSFLTAAGTIACRMDDAGTGDDSINEMYPDEQAKIRQVFADIDESLRTKDIERLESLHLYGPKFTNIDAGQRQDAAAARQGERDFAGSISGAELRFEDLRIDVFGDVAVATSMLDLRFQTDTESHVERLQITIVLVKVGDDWKITHEHGSPAASSPGQ